MRRIPHRWVWVPVLTLLWVLLNGEASVGNLVGGLAVGIGVVVAFPVAEAPVRHRVHPLGMARYVVSTLWSLVTSSVRVAVTAVAPTPARVRSGIVGVELPGASPLVTAMVANAITLTPGTVTIAADADHDPPVIHVHVLGLGSLEAFRAEVAELQRRATAAVAPVGEGPSGAAGGGSS